MKHALKLPVIVGLVFLIGYFLEEVIHGYGVPHSMEYTVEILSDFFAVFGSFSIFAITWYAYRNSKDNHALFMGTTFFLVGLLILFHLLSYPFMPEFITPNSSYKATIFMIGSRLVMSILLLASAYIHKDTLPRIINRRVLGFFIVILSAIFLYTILSYQDSILGGYTNNVLSAETFLLLSVPTVLVLYACYLYARRLRETGQLSLIFLLCGSIIIIFSNIVYFFYELSGHLLLIASFYFFYLALYKSSVELPYEKLTEAEEKLRLAAEERYKNLFDNANDAIITIDLEDRVTSWNRAAEELFGWKAEEVIGKKLSPLVVPENLRTEREQIVRNVPEGGIISGVDTVRMRKDGTNVDVSLTISPLADVNRNVIGFSGIIRDITERKKAEEALLKEKQRLEDVTSYANCGLLLLDTQCRITYANRIAEEWFGQIVGQSCKDIYKLEDPEKTCSSLETLLTGREARREIFMKLANGDEKFFSIVSVPVKDSNGRIQQINEIVIDVSEHMKADEMRHETERLIYAGRAKSDFLAIMSHELRTPLNAIMGFSELIKGNVAGELNAKQRRYVDNIIASGKHLLALINDILDLSKVEAGKIELNIETISMPETINESLALIKEKAVKHNVTIKKELDPALEFIDADKVRFKQVLFNLLDNAVKFSKPEGGTVTIEAKKEEDMAIISVSDTGIGIKEKDMGKLFREFEQVSSGISRKYGGTGLGLAITKQLVELHGGKIWAESKHGEGSTFTFLLPLKSKKEER